MDNTLLILMILLIVPILNLKAFEYIVESPTDLVQIIKNGCTSARNLRAIADANHINSPYNVEKNTRLIMDCEPTNNMQATVEKQQAQLAATTQPAITSTSKLTTIARILTSPSITPLTSTTKQSTTLTTTKLTMAPSTTAKSSTTLSTTTTKQTTTVTTTKPITTPSTTRPPTSTSTIPSTTKLLTTSSTTKQITTVTTTKQTSTPSTTIQTTTLKLVEYRVEEGLNGIQVEWDKKPQTVDYVYAIKKDECKDRCSSNPKCSFYVATGVTGQCFFYADSEKKYITKKDISYDTVASSGRVYTSTYFARLRTTYFKITK